MKYYSLAIAFAVIPAMVSCIQDEPLNAECDIVSVTLAGDVLNREPRIDNDKVILIVKNDVSVMALSPEFELTRASERHDAEFPLAAEVCGDLRKRRMVENIHCGSAAEQQYKP